MDYQKINSRWIYGLTLSVFARNLITYLFIAALNVLFGVAQNFVPFMGIGSLLAAVYLGGVSFMVAHRTILSDETISPGDAFAFTTQNKTFFWQYLFVTGVPVVIGVLGGVALVLAKDLPFSLGEMLVALLLLITGTYYALLAFVGSSLVATAVGADGMMMVSRGRLTFFYSLTRLIVLPTLALLGFSALVYYGLLAHGPANAEGYFAMLGDRQGDILLSLILLSIGAQLVVILFNLIAAVIITKAFLLAEVRMAVGGEPTNLGQEAFGITEQKRRVIYH